jgi:hypothetical protein
MTGRRKDRIWTAKHKTDGAATRMAGYSGISVSAEEIALAVAEASGAVALAAEADASAEADGDEA